MRGYWEARVCTCVRGGVRRGLSIFLKSATHHTLREEKRSYLFSISILMLSNQWACVPNLNKRDFWQDFYLPSWPSISFCVCMYMLSHFAFLTSFLFFCLSWSVNTGLQNPEKPGYKIEKSREKIRKFLLLWMRPMRTNNSNNYKNTEYLIYVERC